MTGKKDKTNSAKVVNKKAYRDFELVEKYEAGIVLKGTEVKSLRQGNADLSGSYARIEDSSCVLYEANISPYEKAGSDAHNPKRSRKLLFHKRELRKLRTQLEQRGFTLVPLRVYFNSRGIAKVELAVARGKKQYDKRQTLTERRHKRDIDRQMKKYR